MQKYVQKKLENARVAPSLTLPAQCHAFPRQLILRSEMRYFSKGSIIADSREDAKMLMVIPSRQVDS